MTRRRGVEPRRSGLKEMLHLLNKPFRFLRSLHSLQWQLAASYMAMAALLCTAFSSLSCRGSATSCSNRTRRTWNAARRLSEIWSIAICSVPCPSCYPRQARQPRRASACWIQQVSPRVAVTPASLSPRHLATAFGRHPGAAHHASYRIAQRIRADSAAKRVWLDYYRRAPHVQTCNRAERAG